MLNIQIFKTASSYSDTAVIHRYYDRINPTHSKAVLRYSGNANRAEHSLAMPYAVEKRHYIISKLS